MTTIEQITFNRAVVDIVSDLAQTLAPELRYQRLLAAVRAIFPCDAAALLQLRGETLHPLAVSGLSEDTLGRQFAVAEQPRLARILLNREPVRFSNTEQTDAELIDPYDGLIDGGGGQPLSVHDCMGAALYIDNQPWGALTLDALVPGTFDRIDPLALRTFLRLAEASVKIGQTIDGLRAAVDREHEFNQVLLAERGSQPLIGKSPAIEQLLKHIDTVASSDLLVLILGETGVGKELVAQQLHQRSSRAQQSMVYVNCAALPETLAESELFGHRRGAFTGAIADRAGKFELANSGTLFLDEVGELSPAIQAKLLRVLQSGEIQRIGNDRTARVDVRVIAATNRDLKQEVVAGNFRADLYHRLSVFPIEVPPLRERGRDVLILAGYFLEQNQRRLHLRNLRLAPTAKQALLDYAWPGNVRELEHVMSRAALLAAAEQGKEQRWITIEPAHLGWRPAARSKTADALIIDDDANTSLNEAIGEFQKKWLQQRLRDNDNNLAATARAAGMDRSNFFRLLKKLGLR
ncbi:MAG: nitric oxide reductase transcriptional regulator NorR [Spongiibacteraceae bacterium]